MLELELQLSQLQVHPVRHLLPFPHLLHYKLAEVFANVDGAPEIAALLTPVYLHYLTSLSLLQKLQLLDQQLSFVQ